MKFQLPTSAARGFRHHRCHAHGASTQGGIKVLLDRREVGIAVDEQGCEGALHKEKGCTGMGAGSNGMCPDLGREESVQPPTETSP